MTEGSLNAPAQPHGTCQICGHHQRLPGGLLAAHGHTGEERKACPGSRALPLEQSRDLLAEQLQSLKEREKTLEGQLGALEAQRGTLTGLKVVWHAQQRLLLRGEFCMEGGEVIFRATVDGQTLSLSTFYETPEQAAQAAQQGERYDLEAQLSVVQGKRALQQRRHDAWTPCGAVGA